MPKLHHLMRSFGLAALAAMALPVAAQVAVVVHPGTAISGAKADQLADVFMGKTDAAGGASGLTPVDQAEGAAVREQFYKLAAGRDAAQLKAYWARLTFTGKAKPPQALGSDAEVRKHVATHPGAIGYVSAGAVDGSVKVMLTLQ